jgi:hypothetical protein
MNFFEIDFLKLPFKINHEVLLFWPYICVNYGAVIPLNCGK